MNKSVLEEFIYRMAQDTNQHTLLPIKKFWARPVTGYSFDHSLPEKFTTILCKQSFFTSSKSDIICIFGDWETVAEGIIFTSNTLYVNSPKNKDKSFSVKYNEIHRLGYYRDPAMLRIDLGDTVYTINTELWSKRFIYNFLQFASAKNHFLEDDQDDILAISLNSNHSDTVSSYIAGLIYSNVSNASSMYFDDKIVTPRGHGFAAEHANHLADIYMGREATILGDDNAKNGADRNVNGVNIQTKYCRSGSACISECFDGGEFRYWNPDGSPMQIEVPSDMYDAAVKAMEHRIKNGEVSGVTDPAEAKNIIRKGHFTYAQARNIAKAGTVESILYDASSGAIIARNAFGITAVISFALSIWDGQELDVAIKNATIQGLKSSGIAFATAVLAGQLSKAGLNSLLVGSSEAIAKAIGPKASAALVNALRSGTNIYGAAAMKSLAKLLRNNGITAAVSFAVLSVGDVANIFRGRISGKQLFKNLTNTGASIAGGTGGWIGGAALGGKAGAAIGSFIAPGAGTAAGAAIGGVVGGIAGSFGGGALAGKASEKILDHFIEDDADKMVKMIQDVFTTLAGEYLINKKEAEDITTALQTILDGKLLKEMFASKNQEQFARDLLLDLFEDASRNRQYVRLPSAEQFQNGLRMVLEDLADENTNES